MSSGSEAALSGRSVKGHDEVRQPNGRRVIVHLPPRYDDLTNQRYPVLILLHGAGADQTQWTDVGATTASDELLQNGKIGEFILVLPSEPDTRSPQQSEDVVTSLLPWIDATYRTLPDRAHRAIGGISRGGGAALLAAANHPGIFGIVGGHSPTVPDGLPVDSLAAQSGSIWLDVGSEDRLRSKVFQLDDQLRRRGVDVHYEVSKGAHDRSYWRRHVADYLEFYGERWRQTTTSDPKTTIPGTAGSTSARNEQHVHAN